MRAESIWNVRVGRSCKYVSRTPAHVTALLSGQRDTLISYLLCWSDCIFANNLSCMLKMGDVAIICKKKAKYLFEESFKSQRSVFF